MMDKAVVHADGVAEKAFDFGTGLFGFPEVSRFVIMEIPGGGDIYKQMLSVEQPELGFTLLSPQAFFSDYKPEISAADLQSIGAENQEMVIVMTIANIPPDFRQATTNLKAPLVFNPYNQMARQVILTNDDYLTRMKLFRS